MNRFITSQTPINEASLNVIAHLPTTSLLAVVDDDFWAGLSDKNFMRIAVLLAQKSYDEGGCPIGGVVIDNQTPPLFVMQGVLILARQQSSQP